MKTIHIYQHDPKYIDKIYDYFSTVVITEPFKDYNNNKRLIKKVYDEVIKDDPKFHYFFEPELIIRISDTYVEKVKQVLDKDGVKYVEYDYPLPKKQNIIDKKLIKCHGEQDKPTVLKNLDLFIRLFHVNSIAALTLGASDYNAYMERNIHSFYNQTCQPTKDEHQLKNALFNKN